MEEKSVFSEILLVPYCHADFAWTARREWHIARYIECINLLLDEMRRDKDYTFCIDNITHFLKPYTTRCPDRLEEFKERVREGRIYLANGGYALIRPSYGGEETYVRNLVRGKREMEKFGGPDIDFCFNADTAGGHSQLAQILALSGHRYYSYFRSEEAQNYRGIPREYRLCGGNNTSVIVNRGKYYIEGLWDVIGSGCNFERDWEKIKSVFYETEIKSREMLSRGGSLLMFLGYDDILPGRGGLDSPIMIKEFMSEWNKRESAKMRFATPKEYFAALEAEDLPKLNEAPDQTELSYNLPMKGGDSFWRLRKKLANAILRFESLCSILEAAGIKNDADKLPGLWEALFEISGHAIEFILESDCRDLLSIGNEALLSAENLLKEALDRLAVSAGKKGAYLIVNTIGAEFQGTVDIHVTDVFGVKNPAVFDKDGNALPFQITKVYWSDKKYTTFQYMGVDASVYVKVPPLGYTTVYFNESANTFDAKSLPPLARPIPVRNDITVDCGAFSAVISPTGLKSVRISGKEISAVSSLSYYKTEPLISWLSSCKAVSNSVFIPKKTVSLLRGLIINKFKVLGSIGGMKAEQTITFRYGSGLIDFNTKIVSNGKEGYFTADFNADANSELYADVPYGIEKRELEKEVGFNLRDGATLYGDQDLKGQFYGTNFALYKNGGVYNSIISLDCSVYYKSSPGYISLFLNRNMEKDKRGDGGGANTWFKLLPESVYGAGVQEYNYSLCFEKDINLIPRIVKQTLTPPASVKKHNDKAGLSEASLFWVSGGLVMTACAPTETGGYMLRLYNPKDEELAFDLKSGIEISGIQKVDLLGQPMPEKTGANGHIAGPREIITYLIRT